MQKAVILIVTAMLLCLALPVSAQKDNPGPAFSKECNYMSAHGNFHLITYQLTDGWLEEGLKQEHQFQPPDYLSDIGYIRHGVHFWTGQWMSIHEARLVLKRLPK